MIRNRTVNIIAAAVAALILFVKVYGGHSSTGESSLLQSLLTLALVVFGLYIMLRGFLLGRRNTNQSRRN